MKSGLENFLCWALKKKKKKKNTAYGFNESVYTITEQRKDQIKKISITK
jgi:hypothetical protein